MIRPQHNVFGQGANPDQSIQSPGVSFRAALRAPGKMIVAERMILPAWFDNLGESFSYVEGQFKTFRPSAENVNETPESTARLLQNRVSYK